MNNRYSTITFVSAIAVAMSLSVLSSATAAPQPLCHVNEASNKTNGKQLSQLPAFLANAVRRDLSHKTGIPFGKLRVIEARRQTWPNGCLGLAEPEEICTQALVEGWRIVLSNGYQTWLYRTESQGKNLRLESATPTANRNLPKTLAQAVLRDASYRANRPLAQLRIVEATQKTWPDACLGLSTPGVLCTQALVPGWRVTLVSGQQRLVYRTNVTGSIIKFDPAASQASNTTVRPTLLPASELSSAEHIQQGEIFRSVTTGGIAGRTYFTALLRNGIVTRYAGLSDRVGSQIRRISPQQVKQFQLLLAQQFAQFNRLDYPAPPGSADFITVTLSSQAGTVRYSDVNQDRLPANLQQVIQAWNRIQRE